MLSVNRVRALAGACSFIFSAAGVYAPAAAQDAAPAAQTPVRPVVVEMFLSQACSQSQPAADLLADLAARPDIVALAWHVDYWDAYPGRGVGPWKDPFARPDFAARQLAYNARLRGRAVKMTPQTVIDGVITLTGSQREIVERKILEAQFIDEKARLSPPRLDLDAASEGVFRTRIESVGAPYDAMVVNFRRAAVTSVVAGDNVGVTFREANVVRSVATLAHDRSGPGEFSFPAPPKGLDCAVIVQERNHGRIVAARYCPGGARR